MVEYRITFLIFLFSSSQPANVPNSDKPGSAALDNFPLIDGHNDLPHNLYLKYNNKLSHFEFDRNLTHDPIFGSAVCKTCFTDLPRLKTGKIGGQFWVAYTDCSSRNGNFVTRTLEQIDVIKRLVAKYPNNLQLVTSADGIIEAFNNKKIASLIGVEGGHSIDNRLSILRQYYDLGVRYLTLTHACDLTWADSSLVDDNKYERDHLTNLTDFGKQVVLEMNRLGMMVDLSHVSHNVMSEAIEVSRAPVIFSHSSAYSVYAHHRNVRDDILEKVKSNGGVVMVNFYSAFLGKYNVTIRDVVNHINHIVDMTGVDHVGIGSDFDGVNSLPEGLEDVSKYPQLFDLLKELNPERWTIKNLEKLGGRNLYRVFKTVEKIRDQQINILADESLSSD